MSLQPFYTRKTLAEECGMTVRSIERHVKLGTARLDKATEKIPGVGVRINGQLATKFIQMMKAKKLSTHVSV